MQLVCPSCTITRCARCDARRLADSALAVRQRAHRDLALALAAYEADLAQAEKLEALALELGI